MYATNRKNPDRRDPAKAGWNNQLTPQLAVAGNTALRHAQRHCSHHRSARNPPLDPPQTRGKTFNRTHRLAINPGGTACQPVHRNGASGLQGCAYSTLEADT
jgi:hypothetical protein